MGERRRNASFATDRNLISLVWMNSKPSYSIFTILLFLILSKQFSSVYLSTLR